MNWYASILQVLAELLIAPSAPAGNQDWNITQPWHQTSRGWEFEAQAPNLAAQCSSSPEAVIYGPSVIQGTHYLYSGSRLAYASTDRNYQQAAPMNSGLVAPCAQVDPSASLTWKVVATTGSLATIKWFPYLRTAPDYRSLFTSTLPAATVGVLIILGLALSIGYRGRGLPAGLLRSFFIANSLLALHFALTVPDQFAIRASPYWLHRLHDIALWLGMIFVWSLFYQMGIIGSKLKNTITMALVTAAVIILFAANLDQAQVGSTLAFLVNISIFIFLSFQVFSRSLFSHHERSAALIQGLALLTFIATGFNDIFTHMGLFHSLPLYPFGVIALVLYISSLVHAKVTRVYEEHHELSLDLQQKVLEKTQHLEQANHELQAANLQLQKMQDEAVESAKLASIGTLATGIAHEINNALNAVNGSLHPLRTLTDKYIQGDKDRRKLDHIFLLIQDGMDMTMDIIQNLKLYAAKDSKDIQAIDLAPLVRGALTILKAKTAEIEMHLEIPATIQVMGRKVSLSQIIINLVNNAVEAMEAQGQRQKDIWIKANTLGDQTLIEFIDNGPGIPPEVLKQIFDPFFTTKDVGIGTGLGLHIVRNQVIGMGGTISAQSEPGQGCTFSLRLANQMRRDEVA